MSSLIVKRFSLGVFNSFRNRNCLCIQQPNSIFFSARSIVSHQDRGHDLQKNPGTSAVPISEPSTTYNIRRTWSQQDTEKLSKLVSKYGNKWKVFTSYFPGRTSFCIRAHYFSVTHDTTRWTLKEKKILQQTLGTQEDPEKIDWESIQKSLPKKRTIARIKQFWRNSIHPTLNHGSWTKEESKQLKDLIEKFGTENWELISTAIEARGENQCRNKWAYDVATLKKGEFTKEEDEALTEGVNKYGIHEFQKIKHEMNSKRSLSQLRTRYNNFLDPNVDCSPWTEDEKKLTKELFAELKNLTAVKTKMNSKRSLRDMHNKLRNRK